MLKKRCMCLLGYVYLVILACNVTALVTSRSSTFTLIPDNLRRLPCVQSMIPFFFHLTRVRAVYTKGPRRNWLAFNQGKHNRQFLKPGYTGYGCHSENSQQSEIQVTPAWTLCFLCHRCVDQWKLSQMASRAQFNEVNNILILKGR